MEGFGFHTGTEGGSTVGQIHYIKSLAQSADYDIIVPADSRAWFIELVWVSGTPTIQVEYTVGSEEIIPSLLIVDGTPLSADLSRRSKTATTITIHVSGGEINSCLTYLTNYDI
ncbi:MAG: hypothetical protein PHX80_04790 [Candidatus Nanoarchaeia archaeon]|nr:hypothetical protein [Candidatus Nanoarchaeia archaeon]